MRTRPSSRTHLFGLARQGVPEPQHRGSQATLVAWTMLNASTRSRARGRRRRPHGTRTPAPDRPPGGLVPAADRSPPTSRTSPPGRGASRRSSRRRASSSSHFRVGRSGRRRAVARHRPAGERPRRLAREVPLPDEGGDRGPVDVRGDGARPPAPPSSPSRARSSSPTMRSIFGRHARRRRRSRTSTATLHHELETASDDVLEIVAHRGRRPAVRRRLHDRPPAAGGRADVASSRSTRAATSDRRPSRGSTSAAT